MIRKRSNIDISDAEEKDPQVELGNFDNFHISRPQQSALVKNGIKYLFPIQAQTFNIVMEGCDLLAKDRTGSGKTIAFSLPTLEKFRKEGLFRNKRGQRPLLMVLVPTRELAIQVTSELKKLRTSEEEF